MSELTELPSQPKRPVPRWYLLIPSEDVVRYVPGWTKSEARAQVKRIIGLDRLPIDTVVKREREDDG